MKYYNFGEWGFACLFTLDGSVFQKSFTCAFPCTVLAVCLNILINNIEGLSIITDLDGTATSIISGYTTILGFLIVFRSQQAYSRWWEAGMLLQQLRGQWFVAYSSAMAFCTDDEELKNQVKTFKGELVRLMSLLFSLSLQRVTTMSESEFDVFDLSGLDHEALLHLRGSRNKVEIVLQWVQRLIVINSKNGVLDAAPPILSRVFQELSRGFVILLDAEKITEFPFPFPYCQLLSVLIIFQGIITPIFCASSVKSPVWAGIATFSLMFAYFGVNYIAAEIEMPCGDDRNDLPLKEMQHEMNDGLQALFHNKVQATPVFHQTAEEAVCTERLMSRSSRLDTVLSDEFFDVDDITPVRSLSSSLVPAGQKQQKVTKKGVPRLCHHRSGSIEGIDRAPERRRPQSTKSSWSGMSSKSNVSELPPISELEINETGEQSCKEKWPDPNGDGKSSRALRVTAEDDTSCGYELPEEDPVQFPFR
eukprot:TRINITY_DN11999_c1_g2_i1.p1 TRINITY_DN11999_c1_g2~~TRINITY_DN11999_c1_g2_i1.p1  ORF type:complete len:477 (+),score=61.45 TRINITY_DN11999_c1_g2_i1:118-1548(+)